MYRPNLKAIALPVTEINRYLKSLDSSWICRSRSFKVVDFGTNRKRVCDFLLVRHSNLVLSFTVLEILQVFFCS